MVRARRISASAGRLRDRQSHAKRVCSVASTITTSVAHGAKNNDVELASRTSAWGPTGPAKTLLRRRWPDHRVPFTRRSHNPHGRLRRQDVENIILKLLQAATQRLARPGGHRLHDEVDKISRKSTPLDHPGTSARGQQALPDHGRHIASCRPRAGASIPAGFLQVDTTTFLFICGGPSRPGEDHLPRRQGSSIGFGAEVRGPRSARPARS